MNNEEHCTYYASLLKDPRYLKRRFWTFRHKPGNQADESAALKYVLEAYRESVCKMQYEYGHQDRVTANWNMVKKIKVGDVVFLRGDSLLYAVGVVQPHHITEAAVTSMQDCISNGRHGENGDLESSSYNGKVIFKDSDVFFEDLSGGEDGWGQRIKVDHWSFFCRTGIYCKDDEYYIGSPYPAIRELTPEAASHLISKLFESYQKEFPMIHKLRSLAEQNKNIVLTGAPGTGKTFVAQQVAQLMILGRIPDKESPLTEHESKHLSAQLQFCQFHPSMDYTDFVEGLRPQPPSGEGKEIHFKREDGIFKAFCYKASKDSDSNYVFIIDEINRGDISKIFGELFFAIDPGYRGKKGKITTQYANLIGEKDSFKDGFYVPENVYIIGTMNDIDRNVESMDFAIRRRFAWEEIKPEDRFDAMMAGLKDSSGQAVPEDVVKQAKERMDELNSAICDKKYGLGSAYQIGPSYFMRIADYTGDERFDSLWTHHLEPLLKEYLRGMPNADDTIVKLKSAYDHVMADNTDYVQAGAESVG